jgi:hypothetical protein
MNAEAVGRNMPAVMTLDVVAAMISADRHGRRYESSPEGVLSAAPPPDSEHAGIASDILGWFISSGRTTRPVLRDAGIRVPGPGGVGGRA